MSTLDLKIGGNVYDHTRALFTGQVEIAGASATFETAPIIVETFRRMIADRAFDVSELGMTYYLRTLELEKPPFIALPIFPARHFRHSAIFIKEGGGIRRPEDLAGKTVGEFAIYGHDAGVWPKGILADEYGVSVDQCRWVIGGCDEPMPSLDFVAQPHPAGLDIRRAPDGDALAPMLERGEIDALISALAPLAALDPKGGIVQLFPDYHRVEREWYGRTGIFPIMHTLVVRRELVEAHPEIGRSIYDAYCRSKEIAMEIYRRDRVEQHIVTMVPWFSELFSETARTFPDDWWAYGVAANRKTVDTFLRYHFAQGLSSRRLTSEDIFLPSLLDT
jgi:4,5-dihydroxyphthalate decarboxylase